MRIIIKMQIVFCLLMLGMLAHLENRGEINFEGVVVFGLLISSSLFICLIALGDKSKNGGNAQK
jgi:hypothetical protein